MSPRRLAVVIGLVAMMFAALVDHVLGLNPRMQAAILGALMVVTLAVAVMPPVLWEVLASLRRRARQAIWADVQGRHHAFGGIALHIEDDGRHCWIAGNDLQRVLRTRDRDDVLAARHAGRWRRDERRGLMLRVDSVVDVLGTRAGRTDPHVQHFRRYLEREVLFPAARRRATR